MGSFSLSNAHIPGSLSSVLSLHCLLCWLLFFKPAWTCWAPPRFSLRASSSHCRCHQHGSSLQFTVHMLTILNLSLNLSPELRSPVSNWWLHISGDNDNLKVRHHLQTPSNSFPAQLTSHPLCFHPFNCSAKILVIVLGLSYTLWTSTRLLGYSHSLSRCRCVDILCHRCLIHYQESGF